ncbi:MAG TPA: hypothetical protein VLV83_24875 [Acidobacteriota bacterium]|nr:hypothetical protein [Acidobacteriota bacterium]
MTTLLTLAAYVIAVPLAVVALGIWQRRRKPRWEMPSHVPVKLPFPRREIVAEQLGECRDE